jgi:hypothetical protein
MKIGNGCVGYPSAIEARNAAKTENFAEAIILKRKFANGTEEYGWFSEREHAERIKREFSDVEEIPEE